MNTASVTAPAKSTRKKASTATTRPVKQRAAEPAGTSRTPRDWANDLPYCGSCGSLLTWNNKEWVAADGASCTNKNGHEVNQVKSS